jgi:hypothetical protein
MNKAKLIGTFNIQPEEYMYYLYMPIKLSGDLLYITEQRLHIFDPIIDACVEDYISQYGFEDHDKCYIYLTVKHKHQTKKDHINRSGWHIDGFDPGSSFKEINYLYSSIQPTIYNSSVFNLSEDHEKSMIEMGQQALPENDYSFPDNSLVRVDDTIVHRVGDIIEGNRCFVKVTFSDKRFNLAGNTYNHMLNYKWDMFPRNKTRNVPYR